MSDPTQTLDRAYRQQLAAIRARVTAQVEDIYGRTVDEGDLDAAFAALTPQLAELVAAGQSATAGLADAYVAALVELVLEESAPPSTIPAIDSALLAVGMGAWATMVKHQIGEGRTPAEAIDYGRYLATRFADNELTAAADAAADASARSSKRIRGWEGIVSPGACDPCRGNAGFHELGTPMYRHPACSCTKQYVVRAA